MVVSQAGLLRTLPAFYLVHWKDSLKFTLNIVPSGDKLSGGPDYATATMVHNPQNCGEAVATLPKCRLGYPNLEVWRVIYLWV
jgi:hypothetical protein